MTRYLVTGASGLLGLNLALQLSDASPVVGVVNHSPLANAPFELLQADLAQPGQAAQVVEDARPDVIIHCAALAVIDACEAQPELAYRVNAELPGELAQLSARHAIKLVHISTDAVFDGQRGGYSEDEAPNPLSVYARTKLAGEQLVRQANPNAAIARVNFYGWSLHGKRSLGEFFYNALSAGTHVKGFTDVLFCPLLVNDLVDVLCAIVNHDLKGVYHAVSSQSLSKYDFGCRVARLFGLDESLITPVSVQAGGLQAARSPNLTVSTAKLAAALGHALPEQAQGLARFKRLKDEGYADRLRGLAG